MSGFVIFSRLFLGRAMSADTDNEMYCYENTLVGSLLVIQYTEDRVLLSSDSISTISILKENINMLAMKSNVRISISIKVNETSVIRFLSFGRAQTEIAAQLSITSKIYRRLKRN